MSIQFKKRPKSITNHSLLQKELFSNHFHELDKALNSTTNLNSTLKMYFPNYIVKHFSIPTQQFHKRIRSSQLKKIEKSKLILLNESVLNIFHKMNNSQDKSMLIYHNKKEENNLFLKKFKNLQNLREKASLKNNSAIIRPTNFSIFDDLVKKYKMNDILIKDEMFKNKDLFKATPIVLKNKQDIDFFYLFNNDKYSKKTNKSFNVKNFSEDKHKEKIKLKNNIKYEKLKEVIFFKKLILSSKKRLNELNKEKQVEEKNDSNNNINEASTEEKGINYSFIIKKTKEDINELIRTINLLNKKSNYNVEESSKKIKNNINDISLSFDSFSNFQLTKGTNIPTKNSFSLIKQRSIKKYPSYKNKNQQFLKKNIFKSLSKNKTNIFQNSIFFKKNEYNNLKKINLNKYIKKQKEALNIKTKFYSLNKDKINNNIPKKFDKLLENIKDIENAYELIKKMTLSNKKKVFKKIMEYFNSKEINIEKIKHNIKKKEIYNFLDRIKEVINTYNCKQEIESLHISIHKSIPEKMKFDLEEISNLDKIIKGIENMYYLSLLKGQSN